MAIMIMASTASPRHPIGAATSTTGRAAGRGAGRARIPSSSSSRPTDTWPAGRTGTTAGGGAAAEPPPRASRWPAAVDTAHMTTGARQLSSDSTAQTMLAGYTLPQAAATVMEPVESIAQKRCFRKVRSRSGLALRPLGVTTKPSGRRSNAPTKAVE